MSRFEKYIVPLLLIFSLILLVVIKQEKTIKIPQENIDETKHWKTYTNERLHFSFKYPEGQLSNFTESEFGKTTHQLLEKVKNTRQKNQTIKGYEYNVQFGADAWKYEENLDMFLKEILPETKNLKRQKIVLKQSEGLRITNLETENDVYFAYNLFQQGNFIYNFALFSDDPVLLNANLTLLENIMSTAMFY